MIALIHVKQIKVLEKRYPLNLVMDRWRRLDNHTQYGFLITTCYHWLGNN